MGGVPTQEAAAALEAAAHAVQQAPENVEALKGAIRLTQPSLAEPEVSRIAWRAHHAAHEAAVSTICAELRSAVTA